MAIEVELPDGSIAEFPDGTAPEAIKAAIHKRFPPKQGNITADVGTQFGRGVNRGIDALINLPYNAIRGAAGLAGYEMPEAQPLVGGVADAAERAATGGVAEAPETAAGRYAGTAGEVIGGSLLPTAALASAPARAAPGILGALGRPYGQAPVQALRQDLISATGAGVGVQAARDADLGAGGEIVAGLAGGFAGPAAYSAAARVGGGVKSAGAYGNRMINQARNPEEAAFDDVADMLVDSRVNPDQIRQRVSPATSSNLQGRGVTDQQIAEIISRRLQGEPAPAIGRDYGISGGTVDKYTNTFKAANPTPMNIADVAVEVQGYGGAMPVLRRGRGAYGVADDTEAAQRLYDRQQSQSGRVSETIQQSGGRGHRLEDEVQRLAGEAKKQERDAYTTAYQHAAPVLIDDPIRAARQRAQGRGGEIGTKMNEAVDLFFTPELRQPSESPATWLKITEARERVQEAVRAGKPDALISKLRRRALIAEKQDEFSRPLRQVKVGQPIQDVRRFVDARQELDQMIERSMQDHKPTPLTGVLTQLRGELNAAARANNRSLKSADDRFYGNRSAERIIEEGERLGKTLTPRSRQMMRDFGRMTPEQQELLRVTMERQWADDALNTRQSGGAANQFGTRAFRDLVEGFYPPPKSGSKGPQRKAERAVYDRGQALLKNLNREAISTQTTNFITGRGNSPTAPWLTDIENAMGPAQAAADAATGRFGKLLENLSMKLARQIGQNAAREKLRILTETDPATLLQYLNRLDSAVQGNVQRRQLVHQLREMRKPELRVPAAIGTGAAALN